ncbi:SPOR domain-containing protein [Notoacmeibacter sp. MSK16QG-6]|uniref:SPOR domain-containing protein n=1 Tax=Notoacmeibacter sp. MSK16QG-6 TaxID=2957982 RepID=UPI00209E344A|nr:SPOR domain-containing protein [Notoacmeibacter sp. MSK16QG-6]MCP1199393.1 SPOR domain-containing protein [Notoacmeibacter sp. MSK16QG-6]
MSANSQKKPFDGDFSIPDDDPLAELTRIIGLDASSQSEEPEAEPLDSSLADMLDPSLGEDLDFVPEAAASPVSRGYADTETTESDQADEVAFSEPDFDLSELDDLDESVAFDDRLNEDELVAADESVTDEITSSDVGASVDPEISFDASDDPEDLVAASLDDDYPVRDEASLPETEAASETILDESELAAIMADEPAAAGDSATAFDDIDAVSSEDVSLSGDVSADDGLAAFGLSEENVAAIDPDRLDVELDASDLSMAEFDEDSFFDEALAETGVTDASSDVLVDLDEDSFADAFDAALKEDLGAEGSSSPEPSQPAEELAATSESFGEPAIAWEEDAIEMGDETLSVDEAILMDEEAALIDEAGELTEILGGADDVSEPIIGDIDLHTDTAMVEPVLASTTIADEADLMPAAEAFEEESTASWPVEEADLDLDDVVVAEPDLAMAGDPDVPDIETHVYDEAIVPATDPLDIPDVASVEPVSESTFQEDALADEFADILRAEGMSVHSPNADLDYDEAGDPIVDGQNDDVVNEAAFDEGEEVDYTSDPSFDISQLSPAEPPADFDDEFDDRDSRTGFIPPDRGTPFSRYALYGGAALLALLLAGGSYAFLSGDDGNTEVAIIRADQEPVKVRPAEPETVATNANENEVYETVEGRADQQPQQNELVDTTEKPLEIAAKDETRIAAQDADSDTPVRPDVVSIQPRKVRTFIVKPDGSIVPRGAAENATASVSTGTTLAAATAGSAGEPAGASAEAIAPGRVDAATATPIDADASNENSDDLALASADGDETTEALAASATEAAVTDAVADDPDAANIAEQIVDIPLPLSRPNVGRVAQQQVAAAPTATLPAEADASPAQTATSAATPPAWVQISSHPSREAAQVSYRAMSQRYNSLLAGRGVNIVPAEISGRGTYYRVNISASSFADATALCGQIKSAGGDCLARR